MKARKFAALLLCTAMVVASFAGCKSNSAASGNEKVTLKYALWDKNQEPTIRKMADQFTKENPNITIDIELTPYGQYWTKLETAATGGSLADVFWMNGPNVGKYAQGDMMMPLDSKFKDDNVSTSDFPDSLIKLYTVGGKLYAMPKGFDTIGLYYNKAIFDKAGVHYPTDTWTWDDMAAAAKKLTDKSSGIYGVAAADLSQENYYNTIPQFGGYVISDDKKKSGYDDPNTIKGIQCWLDLIKDGVSPTAQQMTETTPDNMFESGKLAMIYTGSYMLSEYSSNENIKDKFDIQILPIATKRATVIHGIGNVIYSKTKYPDQAWKFVKWLGGKEANDMQAKAAIDIPAYKPSQSYFLQSKPQYNLKVFTDELPYSVMYPCSQKTAKWNQLETDEFAKAWAGQETAEAACKNIAKGMDAILATEK